MSKIEMNRKKKLTRRDFIKSSSGAVALAGVAGSGLAITVAKVNASSVPKKWDEEADIVIVGTGYTGLVAAIEAKKLGLSVHLLEKMRMIGGNSVIAGGGANAADPFRQKRQGIEDSPELHFKHTFEGGDMINDPEKVKYMVEHALEDCVVYLERLGVVWPEKVVRGFGSLYERTHYIGTYTDKKGRKWRKGAANIYAMLDKLQELGQPILFQHEVIEIIRENTIAGRVLGVEVKVGNTKKLFKAKKGVILASGGFGANIDWVVKHDRRLAHTDTSNHRGATGECIKFAEDIGADTLHMDYIQAIPYQAKSPYKAMFFEIDSEEIRKVSPSMPYRIFVNKNGNRFVDEGQRRDVIKFAGCSQPLFDPLPTTEANSIEELEAKLKLPQGSLVETARRYNSACEAQKDEEFGKDPSILYPLKTPPFKAISKAIKRHHTMGGLLVKGTTGQVIDRWGKIIPGLYAAGEVTGGTHGANRLGHNGTVDCIVFGQLCAKTVAKEESMV